MIIEGRNSVREAVRSLTQLDKIYIQNDIKGRENQELVDEIKLGEYDYQFVNKSFLDRMSEEGRHQGFIAKTRDFNYCDIEEIIDRANSQGEQLFMVILDGIKDPHNFGNIIRTCECAGVHGIMIEKHSSCGVTETVMRVSAGAVNHMPIARVTNINREIEKLKDRGVWVYACELGGGLIYNTNLRGDLAIVIGSEGEGVSKLTKEKCDGVFMLPMKGKVNSLNASNATAIALYEALRQRM